MDMIFPNITVVPFLARKLRSPKLAYSNSKFNGCLDWSRYAFSVPSELDDLSTFTDDFETFFAERYGGDGLSTNGGGARCGVRDNFQVKGIGRTPLAGADADFWHSHGGLTFRHAIAEAVWGEVLARALPFGATQCASIIDPNGLTWTFAKANGGTKEKIQRAMVVRENALRPANFERAYFFRPSPGSNFPHDTERTRQMIGKIHVLLAPGDSLDDITAVTPQLIYDRLSEAVGRFAVQSAAAKAKRIMHGAITSSNICLDGRWIDYGTVAAMPGYTNSCSFGMAPYTLPFWDDRQAYIHVIVGLCFYICKFSRNAPLPHHELCQQLIRIYDSRYEAALTKQFVRLCGFPRKILANHEDSPEAKQLGNTLIRIAKAGGDKPFSPSRPDPELLGKNPLTELLPRMARISQENKTFSSIEPSPVAAGNTEFASAYREVYQQVYAQAKMSLPQITPRTFGRLIELNASNRNRPNESLFKHNLIEGIKCALERYHAGDEEAVQNFIDELAMHADLIYLDPEDVVAFNQHDTKTINVYDPTTGCCQALKQAPTFATCL